MITVSIDWNAVNAVLDVALPILAWWPHVGLSTVILMMIVNLCLSLQGKLKYKYRATLLQFAFSASVVLALGFFAPLVWIHHRYTTGKWS